MKRIEDYNKILPIVEVYTCVQSEGKLSGIPHILIRTSGCTLRCQFSDTDFCDSWYTSWHPDKGAWTWNKIIELYNSNPQIKHTMITGGSPTMHSDLLCFMTNELHSRGQYITLETEGSKFVENCHIDLLSLSPKLSNSLPRIGSITPKGSKVEKRDLIRHEKYRKNYVAMYQWIQSSKDYQYKPVIGDKSQIKEIEELAEVLNIPIDKFWVMAAGGSRDVLESNLMWTLELCIEKGWNFVPRFHILIFNDQRGV